MTNPERDAGFERLIGRAAHGAEAAGDCPDAETMAAWSDGVLRGHERSRVETHVSACARCQMQLAAMARMADPDESRAAAGRRVVFPRGGWWLVPVAGAAAAAGLWFIVQPTPVVPPLPSAKQEQAPAVEARAEPPRDEAQARASDAAASEPRRRALKQERELDAGRVAGGAASAPAAPPSTASPSPSPMSTPVEERLQTSAARVTNAAGITGLNVTRAEDGGVTWDPKSSPLLAQVTAAASPVPGVIWLAGRAGLMLLTTDGQSWRRLAFPEALDLTAISASDATTASVTAADGRVFVTADGGTTWAIR